MVSRRFHLVIALFWLSTMTWLVWAKVVPSLLVGDPPSYRSIYERQTAAHSDPSTGWDIYLDERHVGQATSEAERNEDDVLEVVSRVELHDVPLEKLSPLRLGSLWNLLEGVPREIDLTVETTFDVDPLGRLGGFDSLVEFGQFTERIRLRGIVDGDQLQLNLSSGDFHFATRTYLSPDSVVADTMSPQGYLPGLRLGQRWTVPVYSPFHPPNRPLEILHAVVEQNEPIVWNNAIVGAWLVHYREDSGRGRDAQSPPRGRVWVHPDGRVLRQEAQMASGWLRFERRAAAPRDENSPQARQDQPR